MRKSTLIASSVSGTRGTIRGGSFMSFLLYMIALFMTLVNFGALPIFCL